MFKIDTCATLTRFIKEMYVCHGFQTCTIELKGTFLTIKMYEQFAIKRSVKVLNSQSVKIALKLENFRIYTTVIAHILIIFLIQYRNYFINKPL